MPRIEHIGDATLYLGDCREIAPSLSADAVISDPPYGISYRHGTNRSRVTNRLGSVAPVRHEGNIVGDDRAFDPAPWLRFPEVVLFGADHFAAALPPGRWLVWDKRDGMDSNTFADCELAWCSNPGAARLTRYLWNGVCQAGEKGERRYHPNQKPVEVMAWVIGFTSGTRILDPYLGSGTTGVAALRLGRKFIGIEIEERWFDVACRRIEAEAKQGRLLIDEPFARPSQAALL